MYVKPFGYMAAGSIEEATALLSEHGYEAKLIAGGQSLIPLLNLGLAQVDVLVDGSTIPHLDEVVREDGSLRIGAMARHHDLETSDLIRSSQPLVAAAVAHVGNPRVRNRGTLGGSLAHADPAAELPLAMSVLEAEYELADQSSRRRVSALDFPVTFYTTSLGEGEMLVSISVPAIGSGWGWGFHELARRVGDFALVAAGALARCREGRIEAARLGLAAVADRPLRCREFEEAAPGTAIEALDSLAEAIRADIGPIADAVVSGDYRVRVAVVLALRAMRDACRRAEGSAS